MRALGRRPPHATLPGPSQIGPAPVPDDDGQEHVLIHVITVTGQCLWSSIEPEYALMPDLQAKFFFACKHLCDHEHCWLLIWEPTDRGAYRSREPLADGAQDPLPDDNFDESLRYATGVQRSEDTQEVFVTAYKVKFAEVLG